MSTELYMVKCIALAIRSPTAFLSTILSITHHVDLHMSKRFYWVWLRAATRGPHVINPQLCHAQVELLFDSTCDRIRAAAAGKKIPLPDALMPCGMPLQAMYHVNFSGALFPQ